RFGGGRRLPRRGLCSGRRLRKRRGGQQRECDHSREQAMHHSLLSFEKRARSRNTNRTVPQRTAHHSAVYTAIGSCSSPWQKSSHGLRDTENVRFSQCLCGSV